VNSISPNSTRSPRPSLAGLRVLAVVAAAAAICATVAGCASDTHMASNPPSWTAAGNNGGKADRYAIARPVVTDSAVEVASGATPTNRAQ
jgi:hypothetical protein